MKEKERKHEMKINTEGKREERAERSVGREEGSWSRTSGTEREREGRKMGERNGKRR